MRKTWEIVERKLTPILPNPRLHIYLYCCLLHCSGHRTANTTARDSREKIQGLLPRTQGIAQKLAPLLPNYAPRNTCNLVHANPIVVSPLPSLAPGSQCPDMAILFISASPCRSRTPQRLPCSATRHFDVDVTRTQDDGPFGPVGQLFTFLAAHSSARLFAFW
jgi:hypothetical protein